MSSAAVFSVREQLMQTLLLILFNVMKLKITDSTYRSYHHRINQSTRKRPRRVQL